LVCSTTVPGGFMNFKLFLKTYKIIMPDRCKLTQTIVFLATLGNNLLTHPPQLKSQI
jgi:hypothetical protein